MAEKQDGADGQSSGLGKLRKALVEHAQARAGKAVQSLEGKVSDLTQQLTEKSGSAGTVSRVGTRVMGGESPVRAAASEGGRRLESVKDKATDAVAGTAKEAIGRGSDDQGGVGKAGDKKVTNIIETLDVGLPLRVCYDHWTQYEEFSGFMKGVVEASKSDDDVTSDWKLKIGPSHRSWQATVQEQVPDDRIAWTSEGDKGTTHGVITFHALAPSLTRIVVVIEYTPAGFLEKTANLWRAQGRRVRLDLKHFQRYVTLGAEEDVEGWRGEIREGEVVRSHEDATADEEQGGEEGEETDQGERAA